GTLAGRGTSPSCQRSSRRRSPRQSQAPDSASDRSSSSDSPVRWASSRIDEEGRFAATTSASSSPSPVPYFSPTPTPPSSSIAPPASLRFTSGGRVSTPRRCPSRTSVAGGEKPLRRALRSEAREPRAEGCPSHPRREPSSPNAPPRDAREPKPPNAPH